MDVVGGSEALRFRIAQQEHWREARSVRLGIQPSCDPDGYALESYDPGVRIYREQRVFEVVSGQKALVIRRLYKYLVDGEWHSESIVVAAKSVALS
jgi:hypothetical protein